MASTNEERKRYVKEYIRSLVAIEECIEPYKEQKRELRSEFRENGCSVIFDWLILGLAGPANQSQGHKSKQRGARHSSHDSFSVKDTTHPRLFPIWR